MALVSCSSAVLSAMASRKSGLLLRINKGVMDQVGVDIDHLDILFAGVPEIDQGGSLVMSE